MPAGSGYQGAWQQSGYQGAWQIQSVEHSKVFSDTMSMSDAAVLGTGKVFSESFNMSDATALSLGKVLADVMGISDSIIVAYGISLSDAMSIGDAVILEFGLNVTDQQNMSDSIAFDFGMNLSDAFGIADTFLVGTALYFSDSFTISDAATIIRQLGMDLSDSFSIGDSIALMFSKSLSDAMGLGDNVAFAVGKGLTDTFSISDAKVLAMGKGLTDIVTITDALQNALTIGEQIVGLKRIAEVLANAPNETQAWMTHVGIGSSNIEGDDIRDTNLWSELHRKLGSVTARANTYFIRATFGQDEPTGDGLTIREVGIFDALSGGNLGKRWVLSNEESKDNIDEIVVECAVTILHGSRTAFDLGLTLPPGSDESGTGGESPRAPGDAMGIADSIALSMNRGLNLPEMGDGVERMGISDFRPSLAIGKVFADTMGISDSGPGGGIGWNLGKNLTEPSPLLIADSIAFSNMGKNVSDSFGISDGVSVVLTPGAVLPTQLSLYGLAYHGASEFVFCNGRRRDTGDYGIVVFDVETKASPTVVAWLTVDPAAYGYIQYDVRRIASGLNSYLLFAAQQSAGDSIPGGILVVNITDELNPAVIDKYETSPGWDGATPTTTSTYHIGIDPNSNYVYIAIPDSHATMGVHKVNRVTISNLFLDSNWNSSYFDDDYHDPGPPPVDYSLFEQWDGTPPPPAARWWTWTLAKDAQIATAGPDIRLYVATGFNVWQIDPATFGVVGAIEWVCDTPGNPHALATVGIEALTMFSGDSPNNLKRLQGTGIGADRDPVLGQCNLNTTSTWQYNRIQRWGASNTLISCDGGDLDIINAAIPVVQSNLGISARQGEIQTSGDASDYLFVAAYTGGLYIYNVDDLTNPILQSQSFGWWS